MPVLCCLSTLFVVGTVTRPWCPVAVTALALFALKKGARASLTRSCRRMRSALEVILCDGCFSHDICALPQPQPYPDSALQRSLKRKLFFRVRGVTRLTRVWCRGVTQSIFNAQCWGCVALPFPQGWGTTGSIQLNLWQASRGCWTSGPDLQTSGRVRSGHVRGWFGV